MSQVQNLVNSLKIPSDLQEQSKTLSTKFLNLMNQLRSVSETITSISGPVGILETQRHNAKLALSYVEDIILYTSKIKELISAVKFDNIPYAALLCGEISKIPVRIPMQEIAEFHRLKSEVSEKVKKRFGEGLSNNNKEIIEEYAKLFQYLELGREGIERYIGYIIESLKPSFNDIEALLTSGGSFEDVLVKIFRLTVKTFEGQQENISKEFGIDGSLELLQSLQNVVDGFSEKIIEKYCLELGKKNNTNELCEEVSKIIKHTESFESYLGRLGKGLVGKIEKVSFDDKMSKETGLLKLSKMKSKILELADTYISLESQYMQDSVNTNLSKLLISQYSEKNYIAKEQLSTGPLFELIDTIFFIIQDAGQRGLATMNINSICAILNNISTLVSEDLLDFIIRKLPLSKVVWTSQFNILAATIIVIFNLLVNSKKCIKKLVTNFELQFHKIFGGLGSENVMFKHCLAAISDCEIKAKNMIDENIRNYMKNFQIGQMLGNFKAMNYELTLDLHSDYEVNDPFALKLVKDLKSVLKQWKLQLLPEVFEIVADTAGEELARALEQEMKNKKFNELGALQFQKDIREIISQLQHLSNKPLRHRFSKLKQISELILAKDEQEITTLMNDSEWKLSDRETQGFRRLRIL